METMRIPGAERIDAAGTKRKRPSTADEASQSRRSEPKTQVHVRARARACAFSLPTPRFASACVGGEPPAPARGKPR